MAGDNWISSTRAETAALAAVLVVLAPEMKGGGELRVHIDNATVVERYRTKAAWRAKGWAKLEDRDLWDVIVGELEDAGATARVKVVKVSAHQDTRKQKEGEFKGKVRPPSDLSLHEWGNVEADSVVEGMAGAPLIETVGQPQRDPTWVMRGGRRGTVWPAQARVGWGGKWCQVGRRGVVDHVALQDYQRHLETSTAEANEGLVGGHR